MSTVEITGWSRGFNKVACASTLCSVARLNLAEAKRVTDAVLEGHIERISLSSEKQAALLVEFLALHGATAHVAHG